MKTPENNEIEPAAAAPAKPSRLAGLSRLAGAGAAAALRAAGAGATAMLKAVGGLLAAAARIGLRGAMIALRAFGKFSITTWRLASALDSALWRAVKLLLRRLGEACLHAMALLGQVFKALILWLPTRTGRAYSAMFGFFFVLACLEIADMLREGDGVIVIAGGANRPPVDVEDPILARIGGRFVHLSEIEAAAQASGMMDSGEELTQARAFERGLVESYVEQRLLTRAAQDGGLHRAPTVLRRINTARDRILAASMIKERVDEEVTPETVERYYREQSKIMQVGDEVRARHILVETEEEANALIAQLENGADFATLARTNSRDRATAPVGGEIGWFSRGVMARNFANVAFRTPVGEISAPFETEFGWHIVEVTGRRPTSAIPLAEVESEIEEFLRNQIIARLLSELEAENQVVYYRPEIEPARTAAPLIPPTGLREGELSLRDQVDG